MPRTKKQHVTTPKAVQRPAAYTFELDFATANQLAAALRLFQAVRKAGGTFKEYNGQYIHLDTMDHFEDTPQFDDASVDNLIEAIYNGVMPEDIVTGAMMPHNRFAGFAQQIARLTKDGETLDDGSEFDMPNDDAVATLHSLIDQARHLTSATTPE